VDERAGGDVDARHERVVVGARGVLETEACHVEGGADEHARARLRVGGSCLHLDGGAVGRAGTGPLDRAIRAVDVEPEGYGTSIAHSKHIHMGASVHDRATKPHVRGDGEAACMTGGVSLDAPDATLRVDMVAACDPEHAVVVEGDAPAFVSVGASVEVHGEGSGQRVLVEHGKHALPWVAGKDRSPHDRELGASKGRFGCARAVRPRGVDEDRRLQRARASVERSNPTGGSVRADGIGSAAGVEGDAA
jgi:hypothetical protein